MKQSAWVPGDDGWISDDSDFLGGTKRRKTLSRQSSQVPLSRIIHFWELQPRFANATTVQSHHVQTPASDQVLFNRLEGLESARQLSETVDDFLKRVPPTASPSVGPWIWIDNPTIERKGKGNAIGLGDSSKFSARCATLLEEFDMERATIESEMEGKAKATITRKITPLRIRLTQSLLDVAVEEDCRNGKWMLFPNEDDLARTWGIVAKAVAEGTLGTSAKVAAQPSESTSAYPGQAPCRLICVYTKDFSDMQDVRRVLQELVALGLCPSDAGRGSIYYKCDAYTYLGIESRNSYGIKASLYASKDLLAEDKQPRKKTRR